MFFLLVVVFVLVYVWEDFGNMYRNEHVNSSERVRTTGEMTCLGVKRNVKTHVNVDEGCHGWICCLKITSSRSPYLLTNVSRRPDEYTVLKSLALKGHM